MKNCLLYGFISALAGAFLYLILYFTGLHSDLAKLPIAKWVGGLGGLAIGITTTILGIKAGREEIPPGQEFGYGAALWVGTRIAVISAFLSAIFVFCYNAFINPGFADIMMQDQAATMAAKGASSDQIEKVQQMSGWLFKPAPAAIIALIVGVIFGFILSLIIAAFMKRAAPAGTPGAPPPI